MSSYIFIVKPHTLKPWAIETFEINVMQNKENEKMKKLIIGVFSLLVLIAIFGCSDDTAPKFRIQNERSDKANVQIKTTAGNTININDVAAGQTTGYQIAAEGNIVATAEIQNESTSPTLTFFASNDERYTIVIKKGNPPTLSFYHE